MNPVIGRHTLLLVMLAMPACSVPPRPAPPEDPSRVIWRTTLSEQRDGVCIRRGFNAAGVVIEETLVTSPWRCT